MKIASINIASLVVLLLAISACNDNVGTGNNSTTKVLSKDSIKGGSDTLTKVVEQQEADDYTKRNINLSVQEWQAFQQRYHLANPNEKANENIMGDFNGDGKSETIFMVPPVEDTLTKDAFQECIGGCNSYLVSSDPAMNILKVHNNLGGEIKNIGDLDGDGGDDIMVYPSWWQSNWNAYRIYSFNQKTNQWSYLIEPVSIFANELEKKISFVKKSKQPGFVSAYNSTTDIDGVVSSNYKNFKMIK